MLGLNENIVRTQNAHLTVNEIMRQPKVWSQVYETVASMKEEIEKKLKKIGFDDKIIFTGAGSSGFIGDYLAPIVRSLGYKNAVSFHTTDIVGCPTQYLLEEKCVLVSFGRSGNSPESVTCINIANKIAKDITHIVITCNSKGALGKVTGDNVLNIKLDMLDDLAFAMTSSQSGMTLAAYILFAKDNNIASKISEVSKYAEDFINNRCEELLEISNLQYNRFVVLGAGSLEGLAKEASLKNTELTAGKVASFYNSPLGFRHGPKCQVDENTVVLVLVSTDEYTKKYDYDLVKELTFANKLKLVVLSDKYDEKFEKLADTYYYASKEKTIDAGLLNCFYLPICQVIALQHSVNMGITSDNPFPSGDLNRVVAGVVIHEFNK